MRKLFSLLLLLSLLGALPGCARTASAEPAVTVYDCDGTEIALPASDAESLIVTTDFPSAEGIWSGTLLRVQERASAEATQADYGEGLNGGWLFSILRLDQAAYEQFLTSDRSGLRAFARDEENRYYLCATPTDVQFYRSGGTIDTSSPDWADWEALMKLADSVPSDMILRNGLEAYSDTEFFSRDFTYEGQHAFFHYTPAGASASYDLTLSQPALQGEGGIWCVERFTDEFLNVYCCFPNSGIPAAEYYAGLQKECDDGARAELLTPLGAARDFVEHSDWSFFGSSAGSRFDEILPLTEAELAEFRVFLAAETSVVQNGETLQRPRPISCFFTSYYDRPEDLNLAEFLRDFPQNTVLSDTSAADAAEYAALQALEVWPFSQELRLSEMPVPVRRYSVKEINAVLRQYAGITLDDLSGRGTETLCFLPEYDAYYNFTSDYGPGTFLCLRGERFGDTVRLYAPETDDELTLQRTGNAWQILSLRCGNP